MLSPQEKVMYMCTVSGFFLLTVIENSTEAGSESLLTHVTENSRVRLPSGMA